MTASARTLVIGCGALAHELTAVMRASGWTHLAVQCLPAELHNRPERITGEVQRKIRAARGRFDSIFVAYGDCGTGGALDRMLAQERVERIEGSHCYEFFAGAASFARLSDEEPGTFYLTDFLLRHFERLVIRGLGIDRHPQLAAQYFGNYRRLVYLAQQPGAGRALAARAAAGRLNLAFELRETGLGGLRQALLRPAGGARLHEKAIAWAG
jgi:hypothetical protein